ncbi:membrane protein MLC1 isoform 1-T2 [Rhinophrynus dorsalis]
MTREEGYIEDYGYDRMATLELGKEENRKYHTDLKSSDIHLPDRPHPCVKYKMWIFSLFMGSSLLAISGFSLYLGNVFPSEMDYLRCAAGSCVPSALVNFAILRIKGNAISHYQILFVSTFSITTTCLIWFGFKLAVNPTAINSTVYGSATSLKHVKFPSRMIKSYSIVEVIVGICAVFGGIIALNIDALLHTPYLYVSIFWVLAGCLPNAIAGHVAAEYPSKCLVEVLIATSSVTSPLLFTTSAYLSFSIIKTIDIFKTFSPDVTQFHDVVLLLLMLILLVEALLTCITVIQCVHHKSQVQMHNSFCNMLHLDKQDYRNSDVSKNSLRDFDKDKAWKTVMVQMTQ